MPNSSREVFVLHVDQHREYWLFKLVAFSWPLCWLVLVVGTFMLQPVIVYLSLALLVAIAAAALANLWGGILVWRHSGRCPRWLPFELLIFVAVPVAVFAVTSAMMRNGWAGP